MPFIQSLYTSFYRVILIVTFVSIAFSAKASHLMGSDITYKCINTLKYEVTLKVYRDCIGIALSPTQNIRVKCANSSWQANYAGTRMSVTDITGLGLACTNVKSRCAGGTYPYGIEEHVFKFTVDLSTATGCGNEFTFSWSTSARNIAITTGASNKNFYTEATVFTDLSKCNSSPVFSTPASALVCYGSDYTFNNGAIDTIDNDVISYALVEPLATALNEIPYNSQFSAYKPLTFLGFPDASLPLPEGFHLDSVTGNLNFRPIVVNQVTVMVLEITEHRKVNGVMRIVGKTRRDIQINVINCNGNSPPVITGESVVVCAGNTACIDIRTSDANSNDKTTLTWNAGIPGASFVSSKGTIKNDTARLCWTPTENDVRPDPYSFTVTSKDNGCPLAGQSVKAITIRVDNNPKTSFTINDSQQCIANQSFNFINTSNKTTFITKWRFSDGQSRDSTDAKAIKFKDTGNYKVKLVLNSLYGCKDSLQKTVRVEPSPNPDFLGLKINYCEKMPMDTLLPVMAGGLFSGKNIIGAQYNPQKIGPDTVTYTINKAGCFADTTLYTTVYPSPIAAIAVNDDEQCLSNHLFAFTNTTVIQSGAFTSSWIFSDGATIDSFEVKSKKFSASGTFGVLMIANAANNCVDTASINVIVRPEADAGFPALNPYYCQGDEEYSLLPNQLGGVFIGKNIQNNKFVPSNSGDDTITYSINANGCVAQSNHTTTVLPGPKLNLGPDRVLCLADPFVINVDFPNSTYLWHDGSTGFSFPVNEPGKYSVTLYNTCDTLWDEVTIRDCFYNTVPNVFTPNGDGLNDVFMPYLENALAIHLIVYDRWGEKMFETYKLGIGWDGTFKGASVPDGVYMWQIEVDYNNTGNIAAYKTFVDKGNLSLLR